MSSKNYGRKTRGTSQIRLENKIKKRNPPKVCSDCEEMSDSAKLFSNKVHKIEEVNDNFYKNPIKKNKINKFSIFNAKFTSNNVPCELEYDLSKFSLENLHKLVTFTPQHCNNNNKLSSSIKNVDNKSDEK